MAQLASNYAVRISRLGGNSKPYVNIYFGENFKIPENAKYVCITFGDLPKMVFRFYEHPMKVSSFNSETYKKCFKLYFSTTSRYPFCTEGAAAGVVRFKGWEGEYKDVLFTDAKLNSSVPCYWISQSNREGYTNQKKGSTAEVTATPVSTSMEGVTAHIDPSEINWKDITVKETDIPARVDLRKANLENALYEQTKFAQYVIDEAHLCTQNMQRKFAALLCHRLNKIQLTEEDTFKHYELNRLLVSYIRLQDSVEKLMQNIIEEAKNGR